MTYFIYSLLCYFVNWWKVHAVLTVNAVLIQFLSLSVSELAGLGFSLKVKRYLTTPPIPRHNSDPVS